MTRNCLDGVTTLRLQSTARYSTAGRRRRSPAANAAMFKKAVKDHSATAAKPLQSNLLQSNAAPAPQSKPPLPQSTGVKRKIEMTSSGQAGLSSLHSAVYYDENDFDDDDDLDFSDVEPAVPLTKNTAPTPDTEPAKLPDLPEPKEVEEVSPDVRYPDLPPVPSAEEAPSSSVQLPWSSSPPSHFKKPSNPRTIPWLKNQTQNHHHHHHHQPRPESRWPEAAEKKPEPKPETKPVTPARSKNIVPWMKSESAIKQEQKELRRQNKKEQMPEPAKPGQVSGKSSFFLSDEQKHVLDAVVKNGKSIFFTGSAGTGKSVLMREIIKQLRNKYRREQDRVAITASTGLAACNIGGVTLHSFAGIGLGKEEVPELVKKVCALWYVLKGTTWLILLRSDETKRLGPAGCGPRSWSSMKYRWLMEIFSTSWKTLLDGSETMDVRLGASNLWSLETFSSCLQCRREAIERRGLPFPRLRGTRLSSIQFS